MKVIHHNDAEITELHICSCTDTTNEFLPVPMISDALKASLLDYFTLSFKEPIFYNFSDKNNFQEEITNAFNSPLISSIPTIKKTLIDYQNLENNPHSFLITAKVSNLIVEDELVDGLAIFVTENDPRFIAFEKEVATFKMQLLNGVQLQKIHLACMVLNTEEQTGYKICALDRSKVASNYSVWINEQLQLERKLNDYFNTKETIKLTKDFLKAKGKEGDGLEKTFEAEILNNSLNYFQNSEQFIEEEYRNNVFPDSSMAADFSQYKNDVSPSKAMDNFSVNLDAVKNQSKIFKSVLKLDKNFHVYIHGKRDMIERGVDENGRKYYKLYYQEEN